MDAMPFSGFHGDEGTIDIEPFMADALESVVDTIMLYGDYPHPTSKRFLQVGKQFDLYDWLLENVDEDDRNEFAFAMTVDYDEHSETLARWRGKIQKRLMEELAGSEIVMEKAEQLAEEA